MPNRVLIAVLVAAGALAGAMCARQGDPAIGENIAAADMGGAVEEVTLNLSPLPPRSLSYTPDGRPNDEVIGSFGPGFTGRRLIDGLLDPVWRTEEKNVGYVLTYPNDVLISFFERHPAVVKAVTIVLPDPATFAPKDVEVWTSMEPASERFTRAAAATLEAKPGEQTIAFTPVEARFVRLRVLSGVEPTALEIAEVRVIEGTRRGYTPLFARAPLVKFWKGSPREAAQRGLDWLQHAAPVWTVHNGCFGCHVQSQVLMGQAVALQHGYRVNMTSVRRLNEHVRGQVSHGSWWSPSYSATAFGAMGLAYAADILDIKDDKGLFGGHPDMLGALLASSDRLVERQQPDGAMPVDEVAPPIVQGQFMTTANALVALKRTAAHSADPRYNTAAERGLAWIASYEPETTQDKIFKIIALVHYGTPDQKRSAWSVVETLAAEQQPDGGWKESAATAGSSAFSTGQVLYAFKRAGVSIHGDMFRRGVDFLLTHQNLEPNSLENGAWAAMHTVSKQPSSFAATMWAVIGLAGSYGTEPTGALKIVKQQGDKPPTRNLEIVLDVSGSMNTRLGDTTRWQTALDVLKQVVEELPEDLHVGLRVYGHRYSSRSAETCTDTQLVVPIAKLNRARILTAASQLRPRGETPLIRSVLATLGDLKAAGPGSTTSSTAGGSVILITDGEESCKGDPRAAATQIQASGLNLTLNIVGFTVTGQATEAELSALAGSTGGRYYSAQDGPQLARAVMLAALHRLPYDILDGSGRVLVSGQTSELSRELPPGQYRLRIDALGQVLEESITIEPDHTTSLSLGVEGERFVIRR